VRRALRLVDEVGCDAAVLDQLRDRGTPFVTVSGYSRDQHSPVFNDAPKLAKPLRPERLIAELRRCITQDAQRTKEHMELPVHCLSAVRCCLSGPQGQSRTYQGMP
jgi:hypothetical protein